MLHESKSYEYPLHTHSVRHCWPFGLFMSTAFRPVTSSTSTTPKEYKSAFSVICPLCAYSGAKYLHRDMIIFYVMNAISRIFFFFFSQESSGFTQMFQVLLFPPPCLHLAATLPVQNLQPEVQVNGLQKDNIKLVEEIILFLIFYFLFFFFVRDDKNTY